MAVEQCAEEKGWNVRAPSVHSEVVHAPCVPFIDMYALLSQRSVDVHIPADGLSSGRKDVVRDDATEDKKFMP